MMVGRGAQTLQQCRRTSTVCDRASVTCFLPDPFENAIFKGFTSAKKLL